MAASFSLSVNAELSGLDEVIPFIKKGTDETAPTAYTKMYGTIATANTAQALDLGDVATVTCIVIWAVDYDIDIDCDYVAAFDADQTAKAAGIPVVITYPAGTVYLKGESDQTPSFHYLIIGTT